MLSCPTNNNTVSFFPSSSSSSSSSTFTIPPKHHPHRFLPFPLNPTTPPSIILSVPIQTPKLNSLLFAHPATYLRFLFSTSNDQSILDQLSHTSHFSTYFKPKFKQHYQSTHQPTRPVFFGSVPPLHISVRIQKMVIGGTLEGIVSGPILQELEAHLRPPKDAVEKKKKWSKEGRFSLGETNMILGRRKGRRGKADEGFGMGEDDLHSKTPPFHSIHRMNILNHKGVVPISVKNPLKEHMVEKHLYLDNMSASEKLKIELVNVWNEFKMSESDCGSAGLQVAQLTGKIKHLSSVLHKKDKHSLRGLQAMVQQRKKLLKYLRRTDWDSYCLVLSKLGLRDNSDHKMRSKNG